MGVPLSREVVFRRAARLGPHYVAILVQLAARANERGEVVMSTEEMARATGIPERTIEKLLTVASLGAAGADFLFYRGEIVFAEDQSGAKRLRLGSRWHLEDVAIGNRRSCGFQVSDETASGAVSKAEVVEVIGLQSKLETAARASSYKVLDLDPVLDLSDPSQQLLQPRDPTPPAAGASVPSHARRTRAPAAVPPADDTGRAGTEAALVELERASAGRFVRGKRSQRSRGTAIALNARVSKYPDLATYELVGAWLAHFPLSVGPKWRGSVTLTASWVTHESFDDAVTQATAWAAKGRPSFEAETGRFGFSAPRTAPTAPSGIPSLSGTVAGKPGPSVPYHRQPPTAAEIAAGVWVDEHGDKRLGPLPENRRIDWSAEMARGGGK